MPSPVMTRYFRHLAIQALAEEGWTVQKAPGGASMMRLTRREEISLASLRTTGNQWISFPYIGGVKRWRGLPDVDLVVAASVDDVEKPTLLHVHVLPAREVQRRFDAEYEVLEAAGHAQPEGKAVWLPLYEGDSNGKGPNFVRGGLGKDFPAIRSMRIYQIDASSSRFNGNEEPDEDEPPEPGNTTSLFPDVSLALTIPEAKRRLAESLGVNERAIRIFVEG